MIIDSLEHIKFYEKQVMGISAGYDALMQYLKHEDGNDGAKIPFEHGYFMIQNGTTKPLNEGTFEAHRKIYGCSDCA
ncbi:hypothetical protein P261_00262 [Lachnospiraceae bacterium TWA4]|nr:hypothetical protein P261_00262 [Lachnospiraceae bacterium TWA4]